MSYGSFFDDDDEKLKTLDDAYDQPDYVDPFDKAPKKLRAMAEQVGGDHYKGMPLEPMEIAMINNLNACQFTILKYVLRYNDKGTPYQDLIKAKHTIDLLIQLEGITDE